MINFTMNAKRVSRLSCIAKGVLVMAFAVIALGGFLLIRSPAEAKEIAGTMDFKACTELALRQSPFFTKSAMEIDIRGLDESDSRWSFVPTLILETRYYLLRPETSTYEYSPWYIQFAVGKWDPVESYFSLKAAKGFRQIAKLVHLTVISKGIYELAKRFVDLETLVKLDACQEELVATSREKLTYVEKRYRMREETTLQVEIATQYLAMAQAEKETGLDAQKSVLEGLKYFLGMEPIQRLDLNFREAARQALGRFNPADADLEQAKANSFDLKLQKLKEQLQDWNITLAYAKFLPKLTFGVKTDDLLRPERRTGVGQQKFYAYVGVKMPIFQGFKNPRNVTRQKKVLRQFKAETKMKETELVIEWLKAQNKLRQAEMELNAARSLEKLARLGVKQAEILYNSNSEPFMEVLDRRIKHIEAKKKVLSKNHEYELFALEICHLSGELFNSHVNVAPLEE